MFKFRILLAFFFLILATYTIHVSLNHGLSLLQIFFNDIQAFTWAGQFNFDFMLLLILGGLWVAWRSRFSTSGIVLSLFALFGGVLFISAYLFYLSYKSNNNFVKLLCGEQFESNPTIKESLRGSK